MSIIATSLQASGEYIPPGPADFNLPPIGGDQNSSVFEWAGQTFYWGVTKPMVQIVLVAVLVGWFFMVASKKRAMVPGKTQYVGELGYGFVRNSIARDILGQKDFVRFVPYLFSLFILILGNNMLASVPFFQFPTFSRAGLVYGLAAVSWMVYLGAGIHKHGFLGYLKHTCVPSGVEAWMLPLLIPLEFISNILVRPLTLALRLFCNMFAGHLLLILFAVGGEHLLSMGAGYIPVGILSFVMFALIFCLELLIQFLQAYVFVLLNALYIQSSLADDH